eukprot:scaffold4613_cov77-Skeletonema_dohrnii-CCMP3373.AAC.3
MSRFQIEKDPLRTSDNLLIFMLKVQQRCSTVFSNMLSFFNINKCFDRWGWGGFYCCCPNLVPCIPFDNYRPENFEKIHIVARAYPTLKFEDEKQHKHKRQELYNNNRKMRRAGPECDHWDCPGAFTHSTFQI